MSIQRRAEALADQHRNIPRENDAEAVVFDPPAHDVEGVGPRMFARRAEARPDPRQPITAAAAPSPTAAMATMLLFE